MDSNVLEKIVDFIQKYLKYEDRGLIKQYVLEHEQYGTFDYAVDTDGEIIGVVRWNIDGEIADILDLAIRDGYRNRGVGRDFVLRGLARFPSAKVLRFKRGLRGDIKMRQISIDYFLKKAEV